MADVSKNKNRPTVFVSYSHKDKRYLDDELLPYLKQLELNEHIKLWHDQLIGIGEDWYRQIEEELSGAKVAILIVTQNFLASSFCQLEETPVLLQRQREGKLALFPILWEQCLWDDEPWLKRLQMLGGGTPLDQLQAPNRRDFLTKLAREVRGVALEGVKMPATALEQWPREQFDLTRLPETGSLLFGRREELALLDRAWGDPAANVVVFTAGGGVGKSAVCRVWCEMLAEDEWRGGERALGWSFYSQGTGRMTSADSFIDFALRWFGDEDPSKGSPWDRGERLAEHVRRHRCLLVLDGVEPLQSSAEATRGELQDPALKTLLQELARENSGLCLVSTREPLTDLKECDPKAVLHYSLEQISTLSGRALLRVAGVKGTDDALEKAVEELGRHALAVNLLASYIAETPARHIETVSDLPPSSDPKKVQTHPKRVMDAWAKRLGRGPELDLLHMVGLFDRPADRAALDALCKAPAVRGLNESLQGADPAAALDRLREARLLAKASVHHPDVVDCHPLVREHFGERLRTQQPKAWTAGHERLYHHFKESAEELPTTLQGLMPLYAAVVHGCAAGRHQEAFDEVYWRRIERGEEYFSSKKLGAWGADLACVAALFAMPWKEPVSSLNGRARSPLLNLAGFDLRALGRLAEAVEPMQAGLAGAISRQDWENAAIAASNLSELHLSRGDLEQALLLAVQGVEHAKRSGDDFQRLVNCTTHANALLQVGRMDEAEALFQKAEAIERELQPEYPLLYSTAGFFYCNLLLTQGQAQTVAERASRTLVWTKQHGSLLSIALDHLAFGRAQLQLGHLTEADDALHQALDGPRHAGTQNYLPLGLLANAELALAQDHPDRARALLDESLLLTRRTGMRLFEADTLLGFTRLHLHQRQNAPARDSLAKARAIVDQTGYHRRDRDVADLSKQLQQLETKGPSSS